MDGCSGVLAEFVGEFWRVADAAPGQRLVAFKRGDNAHSEPFERRAVHVPQDMAVA